MGPRSYPTASVRKEVCVREGPSHSARAGDRPSLCGWEPFRPSGEMLCKSSVRDCPVSCECTRVLCSHTRMHFCFGLGLRSLRVVTDLEEAVLLRSALWWRGAAPIVCMGCSSGTKGRFSHLKIGVKSFQSTDSHCQLKILCATNMIVSPIKQRTLVRF